jgi:hypothetical protein
MLLFLLLSFSAFAEDFGFHAMEDSEIRIGTSCLPSSVKESVAKETFFYLNRFIRSDEGKESIGSETKYAELSQPKEIAKACGLRGLQAYFDGKLYPLSETLYFKYVVSEKSECGYTVPRIDVTFLQNPFRETFLLGPGFEVLKGAEKKKAEKDFKAAKGVEWKFGYVRDYFTRNGKAFMVFDETEMGTKLSLFRLNGKQAELVDGAGFEPCGS